MKLKPISFKDAAEYTHKYHRHSKYIHGWKFGVSIVDDNDEIIGVAVAGRPVSRILDDGYTLEILRICTNTDEKNVVSKLVSSMVRAGKALGYTKIITYTRIDETGTSLLACGFRSCKDDMVVRKRSWNTPSRKRTDRSEVIERIRWEYEISGH